MISPLLWLSQPGNFRDYGPAYFRHHVQPSENGSWEGLHVRYKAGANQALCCPKH